MLLPCMLMEILWQLALSLICQVYMGILFRKGCSYVVLLWMQNNYPAPPPPPPPPPYPLGRKDPMENILHKDMFYALPRRMLKQFLRFNYQYFLSPLPYY